ncbi:hypothetical protein YSA_00317 [Pseudomonas putida ND6]|uniref:Uncharacterized protein n=1 Tax=Pseudomonas putida ND6 TaxID=231023 RepID=I3UN76_PSEPU|nr:hypothetical protein YSA_00317 [Pseudomonas putida ND6]
MSHPLLTPYDSCQKNDEKDTEHKVASIIQHQGRMKSI